MLVNNPRHSSIIKPSTGLQQIKTAFIKQIKLTTHVHVVIFTFNVAGLVE